MWKLWYDFKQVCRFLESHSIPGSKSHTIPKKEHNYHLIFDRCTVPRGIEAVLRADGREYLLESVEFRLRRQGA
ncbi:MAG: hypothetical protein HFH92_12950 [Lachnospiraceae bacterium]|uniref:hypothetical protein n=1 Tax=uncultured Acetatifactor sp. TaxID=1671927 RepID=UPI00260B47A2|nr:hypothetical protein [uncultured Acetatifactor sp.]MCI8789992.1 hypothetical protein [Lachnospiraceae bacterium]